MENRLQMPPHPAVLQNWTSFVAIRQFVFGALRHVGFPTYTLQAPPQVLPWRELQYVTVVVWAARGASGLRGSPT